MSMRRLKTTVATSAIAAALLYAAGSAPALAQQSVNDAISAKVKARQDSGQQDRLLVDAKEIIYDNDKNTIAASGDVQMNYQGRTLQADRVTYDRNTGRVHAEGN